MNLKSQEKVDTVCTEMNNKNSGRFTSSNQPSREGIERGSKTRSIKVRSSIKLNELMLKNVFTPSELKKLYSSYKTRFATLDAFGEAYADDIIAYNILRYITKSNSTQATENALRVLKHLDVMSIGDLKETINPVFHFDKYESEF
jgi:hypothetical protein